MVTNEATAACLVGLAVGLGSCVKYFGLYSKEASFSFAPMNLKKKSVLLGFSKHAPTQGAAAAYSTFRVRTTRCSPACTCTR